MAWRYKEWGGIKKAETEVVRIKGRRRDKGGGGWEKQISRVGGSTPIRLCEGHPPLMERFESYCIIILILKQSQINQPQNRIVIQKGS
jgi:hypothetical protein